MEIVKYVLGVAVAAFLAGVGALQFLDSRIDSRLPTHLTPIQTNLAAHELRLASVESRPGPTSTDLTAIETRLGALEARVVSVEFGLVSTHAIGEISQANTAGIVTATLQSEGGSTNGIICGYVGMSRSTPTLRVAASMEYRNSVYMPFSSLTMPVHAGEFWQVRACSGNVESTAITWHPLIVKVRP